MQPELITYQKFNDPGLADELATLLQQHGIIYKIEEQSFSFNPTFYADETAKDYAVKISADDFGRVSELLQAESAESIKEVGEEHYLFKFTNEELKDLSGQTRRMECLRLSACYKTIKRARSRNGRGCYCRIKRAAVRRATQN